MLTKVTLTRADGWTRYKQDQILTGDYYRFQGFKKWSPEEKKALGLIAAGRGQEFAWFLAQESWVKRILDGTLESAPRLGEPDYGIIGIDPQKLYPWQRDLIAQVWGAIEAGRSFRRGIIVGLGGGKTLAGLCLSSLGSSVIVAPGYLHSEWREEAEKWGFPVPRIVTPESAHKIQNPEIVVIDEVLSCKDPEALRSRKVQDMAANARIVVGLTGTPTAGKKVLDYRWLRAVSLGSVPAGETNWRFLFGIDTRLEEVAPGRNAYVTDTWATDRVARFVAPYIMTVDTSSLTAHLPEVQYRVIHCAQPKAYGQILMGAASDTTRAKVLSQVRMCSDGFVLRDDGSVIRLPDTSKLDALESWVDGAGEPVFILANWTESLAMLKERLARHSPALIQGGMTSDQLEIEVQKFKTGRTKVLLAQAAFASGLNLQGVCRLIAFYSWSSSPVNRVQAVGRCHRAGQKYGVVVTDFVCDDTLDARTVELIAGHNDLSAAQVEALLMEELRK